MFSISALRSFRFALVLFGTACTLVLLGSLSTQAQALPAKVWPAFIAATPLPTNQWIARAPYPIPIAESAVVAHGGLLYSFGGRSTDGSLTNSYRYDPALDSWTTVAVLPEPLTAASAVSDSTFIYLLNGGSSSAHLYRYDPMTDSYRRLASAPTGTYSQAAVYVNGSVYRVGGQSASGYLSSVDVYSIANDSWSPGVAYPDAAGFPMAMVTNNVVYMAGGAGSFDLASTYSYTPGAAHWDDSTVPNLPDSRWGAASALAGGAWVLAGGYVNGAVANNALLWDPVRGGGWQPLPPLLAARYRLGSAGIGPAAFAVGGLNAQGTPTTDIQEFVVPCTIHFSDVAPTDYFYTPVHYLACLAVVSGYSDGTFRPYNQTTRAQLAKIVVGGKVWAADTTGGPHFTDVPSGNTFYPFIETAFHHGIISGYSDGTFRPSNPVTRGQLSKIIVSAQGWPVDTTGGPHFTDVPTTSVFYTFVETAVNHGIISGYSDGTFRPANPATRGQIAKIVYLSLQDTGPTATPTVAAPSPTATPIFGVPSRTITPTVAAPSPTATPTVAVPSPTITPSSTLTPTSTGTASATPTIANPVFGDGRDGDIVVASGQPYYVPAWDAFNGSPLSANALNGQAVLSVVHTSGFRVGDEVMIHQTQATTGSGIYEFGIIASINSTANTLTLQNNLQQSYLQSGTCTNGASCYRAQVRTVPNYHNVTIQNGGTLTCRGWRYGIAEDAGGICAFRVSGLLDVQSGGIIDMVGRGFRAGNAYNQPNTVDGQGEGVQGQGSRLQSANGSGGGGGHEEYGSQSWTGGAGGGNGTPGGDASGHNGAPTSLGGSVAGSADLTSAVFGGGGGGYTGQFGAPGGGLIFLFAHNVTINGVISANGADGSGQGGGSSGSGGGAGGTVWLRVMTATVTTQINALGGLGGSSTYGTPGGAGGTGRVRIDYITGITR
ncbi:MAG: S-layer homology domain-containing protein [Chloroflexota bacterium]|nr:S-layer homology domain-containing protein [Chloroflexota bacterium]